MARRLPATEPNRFVHPLSVVRAANNWTHQDVVDVIARRSRNMAARREKAWRWEHWGVVPDLDSQLALAAELGVPEEKVRQGLWPEWLPDGNPIRISFAWTQVGGLEALADAKLMVGRWPIGGLRQRQPGAVAGRSPRLPAGRGGGWL